MTTRNPSGSCSTCAWRSAPSMVDDGVIRGILATVECQTKTYAQGGYLALTQGSGGIFQASLTTLLTGPPATADSR